MERLNVKLRKSTAFRPQTDGQTEQVNQSLGQYLRQYCNYEYDNWVDLLPLAKYTYNNSETMATQMSPFFANYGYHPRTNWPIEMESKNPAPKNYAYWMESMHELCVKRLEEASECMGKYYDHSHKEVLPYGVSDLVMLHGNHIWTQRATKKLDVKLFAPFKVVKLVGLGMSVELKLPQRWRVHNVFHTSPLGPYRSTRGLRDKLEPVAITERRIDKRADKSFIDKSGDEHKIGYNVDGRRVYEGFSRRNSSGQATTGISERLESFQPMCY